jgi:hypothetical protein
VPIVVLLLVLRDHAEREPAVREAGAVEPGLLQQVHDPAADVVAVAARLARREQRQRRALRPRVLERVVERVDLGVDRGQAADLAQQPQLLLVGDVGQVPDQRRHERGVLSDQVRLIDRGGEVGGPVARRGQLPGDSLP